MRECPETDPKVVGGVVKSCSVTPMNLSKSVAALKAKVRPVASAPSGDVWLMSERSHIWARIDSGTDITVVRRSLLNMKRIDPRGKVIVKGAFGHSIEAVLAYVPFRLAKEGSHVPLLGAVTDRLTRGVECLLTASDHDVLVKQREKEIVEERRRFVTEEPLMSAAAVVEQGSDQEEESSRGDPRVSVPTEQLGDERLKNSGQHTQGNGQLQWSSAVRLICVACLYL